MSLAILFFGFFVCIALFYLAMPLAARFGLIDKPGGRKKHEAVTPVIGGLVIIPASIALLALMHHLSDQMMVLISGLIILLVMGIYDDRYGIRPLVKFAVQIAVALWLVLAGGAQVTYLGNLFGFGDVGLGIFSIPFSVIALVLFMNALNMIDGLDGLAGGIAAVMFGAMMIACWYAGDMSSLVQMACFFVPLLAFLWFNLRAPWRKKAKIFMGDAGSLTLAAAIGWFAIHLSKESANAPFLPVGVLWLMAIPVIDTLTVFFIRILRGRSPYDPDRNHLHHRFIDKGIGVGATVALMLLALMLSCLVGIGAPALGVPQWLLLAGWMAGLVLYMGYSLRPGADRFAAIKRIRHFKKSRPSQ